MRRRTRWFAFWLFHLTFCVFYVSWPAFHSEANPLWAVLQIYGAYTGASNAYGFFAPAVPSGRRLTASALCGDQSIPVDIPLHGEARHRLTTVTSLTAYRKIEEAVAASVGAYALGRNPCASAALVRIEYYSIPSIEDYRRGERPQWKLLRIYPFTYAASLDGRRESE
jgi:hypothetical protein